MLASITRKDTFALFYCVAVVVLYLVAATFTVLTYVY